MRHLITLAAIVAATPLLAHEGTQMHMHPHADDPAWLPVLLGLAAIVLAVSLKGRMK